MHPEDSDAVLVLAAQGGDKAAFAALIERHRLLLAALCRRSLGDSTAAEDAVHEAVLQALLSLDRLRSPERFGPWLAGIGLNVCRRWRREQSRTARSWEALQVEVNGHDAGSAPDVLAEAADLADRVRRAVDALPAGQRGAVELFYVADHSYAETARELGIEVGAVKTRLHKARSRLRRQLSSLWQEETMATTETPLIEMRPIDVRKETDETERKGAYVVVLDEVGGPRRLLIWVGPPEGAAIAYLLEDEKTPRPMTIAFAAGLVQRLGGKLQEVRISRLEEEVFYAEALLQGPGSAVTVDARPSDAIGLALSLNAPIRVDPAVLDKAAFPTGGEERARQAPEIVAETKESWRAHARPCAAEQPEEE